MYETDDYSEIVGCSCTLLEPYKGYTEGTIVGNYGIDVVVRLTSGKELSMRKYDVLIYK